MPHIYWHFICPGIIQHIRVLLMKFAYFSMPSSVLQNPVQTIPVMKAVWKHSVQWVHWMYTSALWACVSVHVGVHVHGYACVQNKKNTDIHKQTSLFGIQQTYDNLLEWHAFNLGYTRLTAAQDVFWQSIVLQWIASYADYIVIGSAALRPSCQ